MKNTFIFFIALLVLGACGTEKKQEQKTKAEAKKAVASVDNNRWEEVYASIARIDSYDGNRILESGEGFFVGDNLLVTRYSLIQQANRVRVRPFNENKTYLASRFVAFDRINDLIILEVDSIRRKPIELFEGQAPKSAKTICLAPKRGKTLQLYTGKLLNLAKVKGTRQYRITNRIRPSQFGTPVFVSNRKAVGIACSGVVDYQKQSFAIPSMYIAAMLENRKQQAESLEVLKNTFNAALAERNKKIKGIVLETDAGNIILRLFNETPEYRDNFIRLAREHYFDSLLIHRVIPDFGIQSGAADTRYAAPGESVGWKGPGYTLPAHIVPGLFHRRGVVGSPRKPDTKNRRRRSDGSQFYIVSGRKYFDSELDEIEKQNNYTFSAEQRRVYKTIGGAPHLDGQYTVFGEVIQGMDVVDRIVKVETDRQWRPLKDIRIRKVRLLE